MKILQLPINKFIGLKIDKDKLSADLSKNVKNHIGSMHAGVQFALAESASGYYLSTLYPELKDKIIPLLRDVNMKYKKTVFGKLTAYPSCEEEALEKFFKQFSKKGRGSIIVAVTLKNEDEEIATAGTFTWFIQSR